MALLKNPLHLRRDDRELKIEDCAEALQTLVGGTNGMSISLYPLFANFYPQLNPWLHPLFSRVNDTFEGPMRAA